jgi:hypothetical protein
MKGDDGGYKNVVKARCSCGKDFCNFGDAKGGMKNVYCFCIFVFLKDKQQKFEDTSMGNCCHGKTRHELSFHPGP